MVMNLLRRLKPGRRAAGAASLPAIEITDAPPSRFDIGLWGGLLEPIKNVPIGGNVKGLEDGIERDMDVFLAVERHRLT